MKTSVTDFEARVVSMGSTEVRFYNLDCDLRALGHVCKLRKMSVEQHDRLRVYLQVS